MKPIPAANTPDTSSGRRPAQLVCRLASVLAERTRVEGSLRRLADAIAAANTRIGNPRRVDRRKLSMVAAGRTDVTFTLDELLAINAYLEPCGLGLSKLPLFEESGPFRSLAQQEQVVFLLGSKRAQEDKYFRYDMSRWDVAGARSLERMIAQLSPTTFKDLLDIPLHRDLATARKELRQRWAKSFGGKKQGVVVVGSPRANLACELVLSIMLGFEPFTDSEGLEPRLPFHFCWTQPPGDLSEPAQSALSMRAEHARRVDPVAAEDLAKGSWGLRKDGAILLAEPPNWRKSRTYGVVCMQRRAGGAPWLVIAGLSGAATYACCLAINTLRVDFPPAQRDQHSAVRILYFKVHYRDDGETDFVEVNKDITFEQIGEPVDWIPPATTQPKKKTKAPKTPASTEAALHGAPAPKPPKASA